MPDAKMLSENGILWSQKMVLAKKHEGNLILKTGRRLTQSGSEIRTLGNNNRESLLRECCRSGDVINFARYCFAL